MESADTAQPIHACLLPVLTPGTEESDWSELLQGLARETARRLERATRVPWRVEVERPERLSDEDPKAPADFLDVASFHMVQGPYDMAIVLTDATILSRRGRPEPGLASPMAGVGVVSVRRMVLTPRGQRARSLDDPEVEEKAQGVLLHLVGHLLGLRHHAGAGLMSSAGVEGWQGADYDEREREALRAAARRYPFAEVRNVGLGREILFHVSSVLRNAPSIARALWRNRAPLLALSLPTLATAAIAPALILVFNAEIWDVGLGMSSGTAASFATISVLGSVAHLVRVHDPFFPRREGRVVQEPLAVVNATMLMTVLLMMAGLFAMVVGLMLLIQLLMFPPGLMETWPTLEVASITAADHVRLAGFIGTVAVTTGALGGGLDSRTLLRQLALFERSP